MKFQEWVSLVIIAVALFFTGQYVLNRIEEQHAKTALAAALGS